jgi:tetratricopeptide (TPR) repeat protein
MTKWFIVVGLTVSLFTYLAYAQPGQEEKPKNLRVLDSTISHDSLINLMGQYTDALGVGCNYCHVRTGGEKSHDFDFASDNLKPKLVTRSMMAMTNDINGAYLAKLSGLDTPAVAVQCVTCHRGQSRPILLQDLLAQTRHEKGMAALDSVYRDLRNQYYGSHTFDFSEQVLIHLAFEISLESDADALAILKLNREFNPQSWFNEWALGQEYVSMGDTAQAIIEYQRALEISPDNRRVKRDLDALQKGKP